MEGVFKKVLPLSSKAHLSSSRLPSAYALWLSIPHSKWKRLRYVFQKSTKKTEYKHLHPYKNAKIYIFALKHQLELMHEGIMVFINSNTPFLKSLGTFSQTPSYSWLRGWEYKITIILVANKSKAMWPISFVCNHWNSLFEDQR